MSKWRMTDSGIGRCRQLIVRGVPRVGHAVHHCLVITSYYYSIAAAAAGGDVIS